VIKHWLAGIPIAASVGIGSLQAADLPLSKPIVPPPWIDWRGRLQAKHPALVPRSRSIPLKGLTGSSCCFGTSEAITRI
jgi:hypothetical protein